MIVLLKSDEFKFRQLEKLVATTRNPVEALMYIMQINLLKNEKVHHKFSSLS